MSQEEFTETFAELNLRAEQQQEELDPLEYSRDNDDGGYEQDDTYEEEEEEEEEEETDSEDEYGEEDVQDTVAPEKQDTGGGRTHVYENKFNKTVLQLRGTTLTYGEAKLYGLLDKDGQVKLERPGAHGKTEKPRNKEDAKNAIDNLAKKKDLSNLQPEAKDEDLMECSFKPKRSKEANRAMNNPNCGYDFVSRLGERGDFLMRNTGRNNPKDKVDERSDSKKEDYEASLDKLQCPKCRKYQSFDEYVEKRRVCGPCQERYVKLNVVNMNSWKQRQQQAEMRKQERLKKIEEDCYGDASFAPKLNRTAKSKNAPSLTERTAQLLAKQKEEALRAKQQAEEIEKARREKEKQQVSAARANRAMARKMDLENLHRANGGTNKAPAKKNNQGKFATVAASVGSSSADAKKKKSSFHKTANNISAKFDKLIS